MCKEPCRGCSLSCELHIPHSFVSPPCLSLSLPSVPHPPRCPPFPTHPPTQALVERYISVEVEGLTVEGLPVRLQANGWQARILQHECDHLAVGAGGRCPPWGCPLECCVCAASAVEAAADACMPLASCRALHAVTCCLLSPVRGAACTSSCCIVRLQHLMLFSPCSDCRRGTCRLPAGKLPISAQPFSPSSHSQGVLYVDRMLSRSFAARGAAGRLPQGVPAPGACRCCHPIDRAG